MDFTSNVNIDMLLNASNITFDTPVIFSSNFTNLGNETINGILTVGGSNIILGNNSTYPTTIAFGNVYQACTYLFFSPISATFSQIYVPSGLTYLAGSVVMTSTVL